MSKAVRAVLIVGVMALANPHPIGAFAADAVESVSGASLEEALEFRKTFGFTDDVEVVRASLLDPTADLAYGTPLTRDEAANMNERQRLELLSDPLEVFIDTKSDSFGGLYLTQYTGRVEAHIARTTKTSPEDLAAAMALAPRGLTLTIVDVDHTMAELETALNSISDSRNKLGVRMGGIERRTTRS